MSRELESTSRTTANAQTTKYTISTIDTHTHSLRFNGHFPGEPGLAGFTEAKDDGSGGDNCSL